jgi:hypothetical protein
MREALLDDELGIAGALRRPISERASRRSVYGVARRQAAQTLQHRHVRQRLLIGAGEHVSAMVGQAFEKLDGAAA